MPEYLWTARLEAAATARNVSLTSPQTLAGDGSDRRYYRLLGSPPSSFCSTLSRREGK